MGIETDSQITGKSYPGDESSRGSEAIVEISAILAAGLLRLFERKSSQLSRREPETLLDCGTGFEGHVQQKGEDLDL
jgi:hypothetical protein